MILTNEEIKEALLKVPFFELKHRMITTSYSNHSGGGDVWVIGEYGYSICYVRYDFDPSRRWIESGAGFQWQFGGYWFPEWAAVKNAEGKKQAEINRKWYEEKEILAEMESVS